MCWNELVMYERRGHREERMMLCGERQGHRAER